MENKMTIEEFLTKLKNASLKSLISREYVPIKEKRELLENALAILFGRFDEKELIEIDAYQESDVTLDDLFIKSIIIGSYVDIDVSEKMAVYDAFMKDKLYESLIDLVPDAWNFNRIFRTRISEKREFIKENRKNSFDILLDELTNVIKKFDVSINMKDVATLLPQLAKLGNFDQKEMVNQIIKSMPKKPQDHKKSQKKTATVNWVNDNFSGAENAIINSDKDAEEANNSFTEA